ncbi:MAG TPA: DinB family protein [Chitinophagaceae bacterium]|nr:DinB family protein [Chitinophagaceae bacterium]
MQTDSFILIDDLINRLSAITERVERLKLLSPGEMNAKKSEKDWSLLECIEHLNLYGDFYLAEINKRIGAAPKSGRSGIFKSGMLGNYLANLVKVENGKIKKMKTPSNMNPVNSCLTVSTIDKFLKQQDLLISLLKQSNNIDLTKVKTSVAFTKFIRLRLGDTFRFMVNHIERHVLQAERTQTRDPMI